MVWDSKTGNVERFVEKLKKNEIECRRIEEGMKTARIYVLITFTTGFGFVPSTTNDFLKDNGQNMVGVASSGNRNWKSFAKAAETISENYNVPVIHKFELSGTNKDVEIFLEGLRQING